MAVIEAIATTYLEADATSVTFSSLGSYEHLQLRISAKSDRTSAVNDDIELNFNGDTGTNYSQHRMTGQDSTAAADSATGSTFIKVSSIQASASVSGAANYGVVIVDILDYADDGNKNTTVMGMSGLTAAPIGRNRVAFFSGLWDNTDDVTSIVLAPSGGSNFVRGSEFTLYGLND
jgi:hypothetical protein